LIVFLYYPLQIIITFSKNPELSFSLVFI